MVISTGKSDWQKEVTDASGTLAAYLSEVAGQAPKPNEDADESTRHTAAEPKFKSIPGIFSSSDSTRTSILNGSHHTLSHDHSLDTVLIFPDYKVVTEVPQSLSGARSFWKSALDPAVEWEYDNSLKTWVLPYSCVILLCEKFLGCHLLILISFPGSHKKRDNRCHIAAPKLEQGMDPLHLQYYFQSHSTQAFIHSLEGHSWEVHTQLEDLESEVGLPLEAFSGTSEEKDAEILSRLKALPAQRKALILRNSHIGGHKFSGNAIVSPQLLNTHWWCGIHMRPRYIPPRDQAFGTVGSLCTKWSPLSRTPSSRDIFYHLCFGAE